MMETLEDVERRARRQRNRMEQMLSDPALARFDRMMAERAREQADYIINAVGQGDAGEAWRVRGLLENSLACMEAYSTDTRRGRRFTGKRTTDAAERGKQRKAAESKRIVLDAVRLLLSQYGSAYRRSDGRIIVDRIAKAYDRAPLNSPVGVEQARKIISKAIADGELE